MKVEKTVDGLYRIVLPREMQEALGCEKGDEIVVSYEEEYVLLENLPDHDYDFGGNQALIKIAPLGYVQLSETKLVKLGIQRRSKVILEYTPGSKYVSIRLSDGICCICGNAEEIVSTYKSHSLCVRCLSGLQKNLLEKYKKV